jgi:ubiquinone/menaquinone biosynthesis C-methylase UbiE
MVRLLSGADTGLGRQLSAYPLLHAPSIVPTRVCDQRPVDRTGGPKDLNRQGHDRPCHHADMTDQEARYDRISGGYATWWSPVHRGATLRLLDEIEEDVRAGATRILDAGCGTGSLAGAAVTRWPDVEMDGIDASREMLRIAERESALLPPRSRRRIRLAHACADRLPFDDASFDVVVSAFVLQLVPSRFAALREARRVLRPGGRLAYVTWLPADIAFGAEDAYDEALVAVGLAPRVSAGRPGDLASPAAAVAQLRRAGFAGARARADVLVHEFTPEGYLGYLARFDDEDLFAALDEDHRTRLETELLDRLRAMPSEGRRLVLPIVYATGRRMPGRD